MIIKPISKALTKVCQDSTGFQHVMLTPGLVPNASANEIRSDPEALKAVMIFHVYLYMKYSREDALHKN